MDGYGDWLFSELEFVASYPLVLSTGVALADLWGVMPARQPYPASEQTHTTYDGIMETEVKADLSGVRESWS